jgi:hypothetical protein
VSRVSALRDDRVHYHAAAIEAGDRGRLLVENLTTSTMVGQYLAWEWRGGYDPRATYGYLREMTDSQFFGRSDGQGSATAATHFGTREFARQNPGRPWTLTWRHHGGNRPRPEHLHADGTTVPAGEDFASGYFGPETQADITLTQGYCFVIGAEAGSTVGEQA